MHVVLTAACALALEGPLSCGGTAMDQEPARPCVRYYSRAALAIAFNGLPPRLVIAAFAVPSGVESTTMEEASWLSVIMALVAVGLGANLLRFWSAKKASRKKAEAAAAHTGRGGSPGAPSADGQRIASVAAPSATASGSTAKIDHFPRLKMIELLSQTPVRT